MPNRWSAGTATGHRAGVTLPHERHEGGDEHLDGQAQLRGQVDDRAPREQVVRADRADGPAALADAEAPPPPRGLDELVRMALALDRQPNGVAPIATR